MGLFLHRFIVFPLIAVCGFATGLGAQTPAETLSRVLQIDAVVSVMRTEGILYGRDLDDEMLGGSGGPIFAAEIDAIYNVNWMRSQITGALASDLDDATIAASIAFFETSLGERIVSLENAARSAMSDPEVEEIARETYAQRRSGNGSQLRDIQRIVEISDLVERNVAGALNSNYQFYLGLSESALVEMDEDTILTEVWSQEAEVRVDTEEWIYGLLLMAYQPLNHEELAAYVQFSDSQAGRALNAALFVGFDQMYNQISFRLGRAVAQAMGSSDI